ncbi:MAG: ornithine carbamoyltransferase [Thermodesulfobacteriota bacterium]
MNKSLLRITDLTKKEIDSLLKRTKLLKERSEKGIPYTPLLGKTLCLVFEKASTRTRLSFEVAMRQLGGSSIFISQRESQIGRGEPIKDTARVLSRYVDGVVIRTYSQESLDEFAQFSSVPVINGLTDLEHPCQILTDIYTVFEKKGGFQDLKFAWIGDGNNMANSWVAAASKLNLNLVLACPKGYEPDKEILKQALNKPGSRITITSDPFEAAKGADVLNTDVWTSMGQEKENAVRLKAFKDYQLNDMLLAKAKKDCLVMHCLPAHRGEEITDDILEGDNSVVFDQAENRLHMQKAILEWLLA